MHLADALARFLVQLQADGRSPHTVAQYERHLRRFDEWRLEAGIACDVSELEPDDLARFLASAEALTRPDGRLKRAGSMNALRSSVRGFFDFLERSGVLDRNPARVLRMAKVGQAPPKALRPVEAEKLLAVLSSDPSPSGKRDHALFGFLLGTGARLGSALALDVADVDLDGGVARLREMKGGGIHQVFLTGDVVVLLAPVVGERRSGPLFVGRFGAALTRRHVQRRFTEWLVKAGIRGSYWPHSLRHTFAMRLYERTGDVLIVKEALGHRSITSTMVYARAGSERVKAAVVG